jgi:hypothetical protein
MNVNESLKNEIRNLVTTGHHNQIKFLRSNGVSWIYAPRAEDSLVLTETITLTDGRVFNQLYYSCESPIVSPTIGGIVDQFIDRHYKPVEFPEIDEEKINSLIGKSLSRTNINKIFNLAGINISCIVYKPRNRTIIFMTNYKDFYRRCNFRFSGFSLKDVMYQSLCQIYYSFNADHEYDQTKKIYCKNILTMCDALGKVIYHPSYDQNIFVNFLSETNDELLRIGHKMTDGFIKNNLGCYFDGKFFNWDEINELISNDNVQHVFDYGSVRNNIPNFKESFKENYYRKVQAHKNKVGDWFDSLVRKMEVVV